MQRIEWKLRRPKFNRRYSFEEWVNDELRLKKFVFMYVRCQVNLFGCVCACICFNSCLGNKWFVPITRSRRRSRHLRLFSFRIEEKYTRDTHFKFFVFSSPSFLLSIFLSYSIDRHQSTQNEFHIFIHFSCAYVCVCRAFLLRLFLSLSLSIFIQIFRAYPLTFSLTAPMPVNGVMLFFPNINGNL